MIRENYSFKNFLTSVKKRGARIREITDSNKISGDILADIGQEIRKLNGLINTAEVNFSAYLDRVKKFKTESKKESDDMRKELLKIKKLNEGLIKQLSGAKAKYERSNKFNLFVKNEIIKKQGQAFFMQISHDFMQLERNSK